MENEFTRTEMLFGSSAIETLKHSHVAVFGVGGVGSYVVEVLARSGVGELTLVDNDEVSISNLNRQLVALHSTLGQKKVAVARQRTETSAKLSLPLINSLITTLNLRIKPI